MAIVTRWILALFGMAFAMVFAVGVVCWLAFYVIFACVRWLGTGQKPQVLLMWQQIQAMRQGMQTRERSNVWHEAHGNPQRYDPKVDVVEDVVVREISDKPRLPKD
jgi:hypothetical protein